jgi:microcompartment protein CcmK/EutM
VKMARVVGHMVSTIKQESFADQKILVVQPIDDLGNHTEDSFLVVDRCQAGIGDPVLVLQEGNSIRSLSGDEKGAVEAMAVGIIDYIERGGVQHPLGKPPPGQER